MTDLRPRLLALWNGPIQTKYIKGEICSERHLQCELYHLFSANEKVNVWVEPTIVVTHDAISRTIKPDLMITAGNEIIGVIEIKNVPDGEARYKEDVEKMVLFERAKDATYSFQLDTSTGRFRIDNQMRLSENLLCVYAAISRGGFAHAVKPHSFWKKDNPGLVLPNNFLHLVGRLYKNNTVQFCEGTDVELVIN